MQHPMFIGHDIFRGSSYGRWHPLRVPRVSTVMDLTRALGWRPASQSITSPRAKPAALAHWHTPDYIAALQNVEAAQVARDCCINLHLSEFIQCGALDHGASNSAVMNLSSPLAPGCLLWM